VDAESVFCLLGLVDVALYGNDDYCLVYFMEESFTYPVFQAVHPNWFKNWDQQTSQMNPCLNSDMVSSVLIFTQMRESQSMKNFKIWCYTPHQDQGQNSSRMIKSRIIDGVMIKKKRKTMEVQPTATWQLEEVSSPKTVDVCDASLQDLLTPIPSIVGEVGAQWDIHLNIEEPTTNQEIDDILGTSSSHSWCDL